jgi:DNA primase catalytic subunit
VTFAPVTLYASEDDHASRSVSTFKFWLNIAEQKNRIESEYDASNPQVMLQYYNRLYPFKSIYKWLNQEQVPSKLFINREFAFTLAGDIYLRYNSFTTSEELKAQVCKFNPSRFEIGAIYSAKVSTN